MRDNLSTEETLSLLRALRELGATRVSFYPEGGLDRVEFAPPPSPDDAREAPIDPDLGIPVPKAFRELMKPGSV